MCIRDRICPVRLLVVQQHREQDVLFYGQFRDEVECLKDCLLYTSKKLKADVRSLRIRLQALNADAATTAEETAHAIQLLLAQASVDTCLLYTSRCV